jgi:hypothetical protein
MKFLRVFYFRVCVLNHENKTQVKINLMVLIENPPICDNLKKSMWNHNIIFVANILYHENFTVYSNDMTVTLCLERDLLVIR